MRLCVKTKSTTLLHVAIFSTTVSLLFDFQTRSEWVEKEETPLAYRESLLHSELTLSPAGLNTEYVKNCVSPLGFVRADWLYQPLCSALSCLHHHHHQPHFQTGATAGMRRRPVAARRWWRTSSSLRPVAAIRWLLCASTTRRSSTSRLCEKSVLTDTV